MTKVVTDAEIRKEVRAALKKNDVVAVSFIKANGKLRKMNCTVKTDLIPKAKRPTSEAPQNNEVQRVFDVDLGEWRSFRYDLLVSVDVAKQ